MGEVCMIPNDLRCCLGQRMVLLRPDAGKCDGRFLLYAIQSPAVQNQISWSEGTGSTVSNLRIPHLEALRVPTPALAEQQAIAGVLGALDDKIEQNRRTGRALEGLARATFKAWFVDFEPVKAKAAGQTSFPGLPAAAFAAIADRLTDSPLGPVPQGWEVGFLVDLCEILSGGTPKTNVPEYWDGGIGWASAKDVSQCGELFLLSTERRITERGLEESATQMIPTFATVVVARGATTGRMTMFAEPFAMNQTCYALVCRQHPFFFNLLCASSMNAMVQAAHGSVFDTITKSTIDNCQIVVPPAEHRTSFEEWVSPLFNMIRAGQVESSKLATLRDYLLPGLLSRRVRVREAEARVEDVA